MSAIRRTSLGPSLQRDDRGWRLDLAALPLFHGLSVLSRTLGERVLQQLRADRVDVDVEHAIAARENPELLELLRVRRVRIGLHREAAERVAQRPEAFQERLRALFGTLQRSDHRAHLFPDDGCGGRALVFEFPQPEGSPPLRFVLESVAAHPAGSGWFLRITIEEEGHPRLDLSAIAHVHVEDLDRRRFIAGSTRISHAWTEAIHREAERAHRSLVEKRQLQGHLFARLDDAGLTRYERVQIAWSEAILGRLLQWEPRVLQGVLKKALLALEDLEVRSLLQDRELLDVDCGEISVFLGESQHGRVLNLSIGEPYRRARIDAYLERTHRLRRIAASSGPSPLDGVSVCLVHHDTAEILALIAALRALGCRDLVTVFVNYSGETPAQFLDALLDLPTDEFRCSALVNIPDPHSVEGHYRVSHRFSSRVSLVRLDEALRVDHCHFGDALRALATRECIDLLARCSDPDRRLLLIEDGGYVAPVLNRLALQGRIDDDLRRRLDLDEAELAPLRARLEQRWIGTVEHTRNGHDRLETLEAEFGRLATPAITIARSRVKVEVEAREVAATVISAIESVLHAHGRVLGRRACLVIGARGAIGSRICAAMATRMQASRGAWGVDPATAPDTDGAPPWTIAPHIDALPGSCLREMDLVIGVSGISVLTGEHLATWLLEGSTQELFLASGSTKTVEFMDLAEWVEALLRAQEPSVRGHAVTLDKTSLVDPQTGRSYGQRYRFRFVDGGAQRERDVFFLAGGMPINFLYYGVPTEVIDEVLAELLQCALALPGAAGAAMQARLHVVDHDVDACGHPLAASPLGATSVGP